MNTESKSENNNKTSENINVYTTNRRLNSLIEKSITNGTSVNLGTYTVTQTFEDKN